MTLLATGSDGSAELDRPAPPLAISLRPFSSLADVSPEPNWLWRGFLAPGLLTMLYGDAFEGKSTLITSLLVALQSGTDFLGCRTRTATAVLVSEEDDTAIRARMARDELEKLEGAMVTRTDGVHSHVFGRLIDHVSDQAVMGGHELLVIDTFPGLAGLRPEEENDAAAVTQALRPLLNAASKGLAVLFLHHRRKNGAGSARGSGAFRGVVDISVGFRRKGATITLGGDSRYDPPPRAQGTLTAAQSINPDRAVPDPIRTEGSVDERLLAAISTAPDGLTYGDFAHYPGLSINGAKKRLPRMHGEGLVERVGGVKGNPARYSPLNGAVRGA